MLPYQEDGMKLERLLKKLFEDDDELTPEGVLVIRSSGIPKPSRNCCSISYTNYDG